MKDEIPNLEIRQALRREAGTAFELVQEYYEAAGVLLREDLAEFAQEYFDGGGFWLARVGEELAGCVGLRSLAPADSRPSPSECAEIKRMYVREKWRGRRIAQELLETAEQAARSARYRWVYLDTTGGMKAAQHLYERNGYERCERYNSNPQATIFMRKKLWLAPGAG